MTINRIKVLATLSMMLPVLALTVFYRAEPVSAIAVPPMRGDAATTYKTKCAMCHSPKAEKLYENPAAPVEEQVEAVLKGKKGKKPPDMPAFGAKGMTAAFAEEVAGTAGSCPSAAPSGVMAPAAISKRGRSKGRRVFMGFVREG